MKNNVLSFVDFAGLPAQVEQLEKCLAALKPYYIKQLRRAKVDESGVQLDYNFSVPWKMQIEKELASLLINEVLPTKIEFKRLRRPAELHPKAIEALEWIKKQMSNRPDDFRWITSEIWPAIYYLESYHFLSLDWKTEILGFDQGCSKMVCKRWLTDIQITEDEGKEHLLSWADVPSEG